MKQRAAIFAGVLAFGLAGTSVTQAQTYYYGPPRGYDALPPYEIMRIVRATGLAPLARPERRGPTYVVIAANRSGGQMRVIVDARTGDILNVNPMVAMRSYGARPDFPYDAPRPGVAMPDDRPGAFDAGAAGPRYDENGRRIEGLVPVPPRDVPNARVANAPTNLPPRAITSPPAGAPQAIAPPPARTPIPRPRPSVAAVTPAATPAVPPATTPAAAVPVMPATTPAATPEPLATPTATAPAIIKPPTQMVPVAPLE